MCLSLHQSLLNLCSSSCGTVKLHKYRRQLYKSSDTVRLCSAHSCCSILQLHSHTHKLLMNTNSLNEPLPRDCAYFISPRTTGHGGGVATVFKLTHSCKLLPIPCYQSFEMCFVLLNYLPKNLLCCNIQTPERKGYSLAWIF